MPFTKRVVLLHPSGLYQILGDVSEGQPDDYVPAEAGVLVNGVPTAVNLIKATPRYWLYAPVTTPPQTFDPDQL